MAELPRLLTSGHNNVKIGRDVRPGHADPFEGYWIYTLSFEERATCPESCQHWLTCYGNNMPYAKRIDHTDFEALETKLRSEVESHLAKRGRRGILVRLHALGDFFSAPYVRLWDLLLHEYPRLAAYGYTAHDPDSFMGREINRVKAIHRNRFAIRWSNGQRDEDCTVPIHKGDPTPKGAFVCPEQLNITNASGQPLLCATCGLCWRTKKNVAFMEH